jgi:tRNA threonylcarbamoyladenosine biosynthesis protein TsaE
VTETQTTKSAEETIQCARTFASTLKRNDVVALMGELGSGKTQFVKGICKYFSVRGIVSSPTFVLMHRYEGIDSESSEILIYHLDLYRISSPAEVLDLGYEEFLRGNGIALIEWAENLGGLMPSNRIEILMSLGAAENERTITIQRVAEEPSHRQRSRMLSGKTVRA